MELETLIALIFRFTLYTFFGLSLEVIFSVTGIENALLLDKPLNRRVERKYLEGFVSLYMIPLHGLGVLFLFEPCFQVIHDFPIYIRFLIWAFMITFMEVLWGALLKRVLGFYTWDYYKLSKFKIFKEGYTLWTLVPLWGVAGLILEQYSSLLIFLSPHVVSYFLGR